MRRTISNEDYFDEVVTASLKQSVLCLLFVYAVYFVDRYLRWESGWARDFTLFSLATQIVLVLLVRLSLQIEWPSKRSGALHGVVAAALVSACSSQHFALGLEHHYTNIMFLLLVSCGALLLDLYWTPFTFALLSLEWMAAVKTARGYLSWTEVPPLLSAALLAGIVFHYRRKLFHREFTDLSNRRSQSELLTRSLEQAQADWSEFEERAAQRAQARDITLKQLKEEVEAKARLQSLLEDLGEDDPLGRLAGGVAHDFANLLTILQLNFEELADCEQREGEQRELISQGLCASEEIGVLVDQLLAYSRKQKLRSTVHYADEFLREFAQGLGALLPEDIQLQLSTQGNNARILGDKAMLKQALLNLVLNASESMPEGGMVRLASHCRGETVEFSVEDRGAGMTEEQLELALDPYFTTKGLFNGRGLGLSVVDGILNQHGGKLELTSKPGEGTTAIIRIPKFKTNKSAPRRALLVEDEETTRVLVSR